MVNVTQHQVIRCQFASIVSKAADTLQKKGISVEDLVLFLVTACSSEDDSDFVAEVTKSPSTIPVILRAIGSRGPRNFYLLQSLVNVFASDDDQLQLDIQHYKRKLAESFPQAEIEPYLESKQPMNTLIFAIIISIVLICFVTTSFPTPTKIQPGNFVSLHCW